MITYKDSAHFISLGQAQALLDSGIAVIINDGADVTFERSEEE